MLLVSYLKNFRLFGFVSGREKRNVDLVVSSS